MPTPLMDKLERFNLKEFLKREDIKDHACYLVDVAYDPNNCVHRAVLFMGFKATGGYCELYNKGYEGTARLGNAYYLKVLREICSPEDMDLRLAN